MHEGRRVNLLRSLGYPSCSVGDLIKCECRNAGAIDRGTMNTPNQSNRPSPTALGYLSGRRPPLNAAAAPVRRPDLEVGQVRRGLDYLLLLT